MTTRMTAVDGWAHYWFGTVSMLAVDALSGVACVAAALFVSQKILRRPHRFPELMNPH